MSNRVRYSPPWSKVLAALALALIVGPALANPPPSVAAAAPSLTDEELRTACGKVQAIGGMVYTYYLTGSPDEAKRLRRADRTDTVRGLR